MVDVVANLYEHVANPLGIPEVWPAEMRVIPSEDPTPAGYARRFTAQGYTQYLAEHQALYNAWRAEQPAPVVRQDVEYRSIFYTSNVSLSSNGSDRLIPFNAKMRESSAFQLEGEHAIRVLMDSYVEIDVATSFTLDQNSTNTQCDFWLCVDEAELVGTRTPVKLDKKGYAQGGSSFAGFHAEADQVIHVHFQRVRGAGLVKTVPDGCRVRLVATRPSSEGV